MLNFLNFNLFLFLFKVLLIFCAFWVIFSSNPIHSVIFLVLVFFNGSVIFLLLKAEFLAIIYIVIYVGAIAVLFLFVVMMLDFRSISEENRLNYVGFGFLIFFIFISQFFFFVSSKFNNTLLVVDIIFENSLNGDYFYYDWLNYINNFSNLEILGQVIYTHFLFFFVFCGFILLSAMISSISLTLSEKLEYKRQYIHDQVYRQSFDTIFISSII